LPSFYDSSLVFQNNYWEHIFYPVGYNFGDDLKACVAQGDGAEFVEGVGSFFFGD